eukprot:3246984-Amphidinium_carterae.2
MIGKALSTRVPSIFSELFVTAEHKTSTRFHKFESYFTHNDIPLLRSNNDRVPSPLEKMGYKSYESVVIER